MRRELRGLLLTFGFAWSGMGVRQASAQDLSSPKATVRTFIAAVNKRDKAAMQQCIQGDNHSDLMGLLFNNVLTSSLDFGIVTLVEERDGDHARVAAEFTLKMTAASKAADTSPTTLVDLLTLEKQGERWLLVTDPAVTKTAKEESSSGPIMYLGQKRPLSFAVALAASPEAVKAVEHARDAARSTACLSNMKQIGLAVMLYLQDHDERFPPKATTYIAEISAYTKNIKQLFNCPLDPAGTVSYSFNGSIAGLSLAVITLPARTVMLYEGKDGKLDFRHDGKAHVVFTDGHAESIEPGEDAGLVWTVKAPPQKAKPTPKKSHR